MDLYITRLVIGNTDNEIFCGIGKTFAGAVKALRQCIPQPINHEVLSTAPTGIICRWTDNPNTYIWFKIHKHPTFNSDTAWVITKRNDGQMTERLFALFDSKDKAIKFIEQQVDEPMYTFKEKCKIIEVDGYKPFAKIIGDENPELNRVHFTIYETEVKE